MQYFPIIEIAIRACKSGGIDTKVHGVTIIGRVDMNEDEVAANFSFLTVEEESGREAGVLRQQQKKAEQALDGCKVFVWGLNDRSQLGTGMVETKVRSLPI